jgi:hypothetical protein
MGKRWPQVAIFGGENVLISDIIDSKFQQVAKLRQES